MKQFEVGKLYGCQKYYLMIFPTAITAAELAEDGRTSFAHDAQLIGAAAAADFWSKELNCKVQYSNPNDIFMIVDQKQIDNQIYIKILCGEKLGWIILKDWVEIHEALENN